MTTPTPPTSPLAGSWVEAWLSAPRFAVYLTATGGDRARALALYEWNAQLSAALLHDLRNRVAHHEPLLNTDVAARLADLLGLAKRLDPQLGQHVQATSTVASLLATRP